MWEAIDLRDIGPLATYTVVILYIAYMFWSKISNKAGATNTAGFDAATKAAIFDTQRRVNDIEKDVESMKEKIRNLYEWHNAKDEDGVFRWWNKPSTIKAIEGALDNIANQMSRETDILKRLAEKISSLTVFAP
jgi:peptidoglycan hydrolase CwlO-like protein